MFLPLHTPLARADATPLVLDGVGTDNCHGQYSCVSQVLTAAKGHDVIIVIAETIVIDREANITTISDTNNLRFELRASNTSRYGGYPRTLWEYYARATSPLDSDNITLIVQPDVHHALWSIQAIAISGANTRSIFDPNLSTPSVVQCPGPNCGDCTADALMGTCSNTIQTSNIDFVIAAIAINDAPTCGLGVVPGFTNLAGNGNFEFDYAITSVRSTPVEFECNGTDATLILMDAVSFHGALGT